MEYLQHRFKMSPIYMVPDVPEYILWESTIPRNEIIEWPPGKMYSQKPYRCQDVDHLSAEYFVTFQFLGPVEMTNFKMHPSWEEANVVVRIWAAWMEYDKARIARKWHLIYMTSHSNEMDSSANYNECSELINTIRIEFDRNFPLNALALKAILCHRTEFPIFYPMDNILLYGGAVQTLMPIETKSEVRKSNGKNFTETYLPSELLYDIFDRLDLRSLNRCAQVNKRWNSIASDPYFYRNVDLKTYWNKINGNTLEKLKKKLCKVRKLDMAWCNEYLIGGVEFNNSMASILETVKDTLTHLSLNLTGWLTKPTINRIFDCQFLEELRLRNHDFHLDDNWSMSCCNDRMMRLKTLDISLSSIGENHLIKILENIPNLEHLAMNNCKHLQNLELILTTVRMHNLKLKTWSSAITFFRQNSSEIYEGFGNLTNLEHLNLNFCEPSLPYETNCFQSITRNCQKLKRLELGYWKRMTDEKLLPVTTQCKQLRHLNISVMPKISFVTLSMACDNLPNLQEICVSVCRHISKEMIELYREVYPDINFYQ
ncbi:hypothetical protein ABEB36_013363 [Hypothenemus hampei]|uniref:F-box domain-containing protein n=1 Tax=Hypothenemus hampei TaxID=57062 RepID=A0ABD1E9S7_HYPHA